MQYKTIVLEMLQNRTELHEQLRRERKLLTTMEAYATELKASHEAIRADLQQANPGSDPIQSSSEAFELAIQKLKDRLPPESEVEEPAELSLDGAMAFIRSHSRRG